uniref:Uncharacterized protein n=1 Tax=Brassica oleracea TaxID=3712 RepID=A0A3P6BXY8_BRAOL|nr:unnamed protein product [Brassica oleracea]
MGGHISGIGIWVTTKIEPNELIVSSLMKTLNALCFLVLTGMTVLRPRRNSTTQLTSLERTTSLNQWILEQLTLLTII